MNYKQLHKITMKAFFIAAVGSFVLSLNGFDSIFNHEGASFQNSALASVIAVVSSALIYISWKWLFYTVEICDTPQSLTAVMLIGLVMQIFVFSVSSVPGTIGLAGQKALGVHMQRELMDAENLLEAQELYNKSVSAILPELLMEKERFWERGQAEFERGADTGHPGPGAVADSQKAISMRLGSLITEIEKANIELEEHIQKALGILESARNSVSNAGSPSSTSNELARHIGELRSLFVQMKSRDVAGMIKRTIDALPSEIDTRISWAKGESLRNRQKAIIGRIRKELEATTLRMKSHLNDLDKLRVHGAFELKRITAMKATFLYWDELIMVWLTSIMIDSFGYLILCLLLIQTHWLDQERRRSKEVRKTTVEEIRNVKDGEHFASKPGGPSRFMGGMEIDHYGQGQREKRDV